MTNLLLCRSITRRTVLSGAASAVSALLLAACGEQNIPTLTPMPTVTGGIGAEATAAAIIANANATASAISIAARSTSTQVLVTSTQILATSTVGVTVNQWC